MLRLLVRFLNWFWRIVFGPPLRCSVVYEGHFGFEGAEAAFLDEMLPLWNAQAEEHVKTWFASRDLYWMKIKPVPLVGGVGVFNGPLLKIPRGTIFGFYGCLIVKDDAMDIGRYEHDMLMVCDFSTKLKGQKIAAYINGDPALLKEEIFTARINHSCRPNCKSEWRTLTVRRGTKSLIMSLVFYETTREIGRGAELWIDYGRKYVRGGRLTDSYVRCMCNGGHCPFNRMMLKL